MKQLYTFLIALCGFCGATIAQDHQEVKLNDGRHLIEAVNLKTGLVLLTGKTYYYRKNLDWKITYFSPHLGQKYEVPVQAPALTPWVFTGLVSKNYAGAVTPYGQDVFYPAYIVASPSGNNVYYIRHAEGTFSKALKTQHIVHIDSSGFTSSFDVRLQYKYRKLNVVFADDEYLYFVVKDRAKGRRGRHSFPLMKFMRVGKDKTLNTIDIKLPDPDPDATEWSYLGHTGVVSYFVSRTIDDDNKKQTFRIAVIDHNGNLQDDFKMDIAIKDGFMPALNYCDNEGTHVVDNHDIRVIVTSNTTYGANGSSTTTTSEYHLPNPEAYGNIALDPLTNGFYVYGLSATAATDKKAKKRMKRGIGGPSGYYVFKFDQDGKQLWSYDGKLTGVDDDYRDHTSFDGRSIKLSYGANGILRFQTFDRPYRRLFSERTYSSVTYEMNPQTGKYITFFANTFEKPVTLADLGQCHKSGDKTDMAKFEAKGVKGEYAQLNFRMLDNNILIRNFYQDGLLEMYDFSDE